ncbi:HD domain-containing protein [Acinetobacter baylyi]|uniref:HD domain-containing protein n=1 Tax=Acinetobacter baylyi TaxID=202950 RepID=UPI0031D05DB5
MFSPISADQELYSLEKHFEIVASRHPHLKLLESQWRFDQELISKALQNVSSIFPHYSRHDVSHSRQIIVNIERLLGDKIKFLSATDTWLILEAAYNHDIGMVITQKQIQDMNTPEFEEFVLSLKDSSDVKLQKFAKKWIQKKAILPQKAEAHDFMHQYIQLLAEWYRKKHPINSAKIVRNPVEEIGLNSSRNELLPKRLFDVLADICKSHGDNFDTLIKSLPKAEAGMASEDCHPLYVACLLRMGDLLDIDDNRFCPVMMSMCGHNLPNLSKAHYDKHHSIKHFRLDAERIEIKCLCPTPESYEAAYDWFNWLQQEYHQQTQHWDQIVPCKELGRLPTLMTPIVDIDEPYLILSQGKKPSFQVNEEAILKLVRGTGLYSSKFESIREILQNAVDSTLHRIWLEHRDEIIKLTPTSEKLKEIYDSYKITITFEPKQEESNQWRLRIKDKGIGISFNDLKYMLEIGSSFKNKDKQKRVMEMPMWFRPSGAFGIGLQSAYLLADNFNMITHSFQDNQKLKISFNNKNKSVIIEKITKNIDIGTEFIIDIDIKKLPKNISYSSDDSFSIDEKLKELDIIDPDFNLSFVETIQIRNSINKFLRNSPISSNLKLPSKEAKPYFDKETNILFHLIDFGDFNSRSIYRNYFRGQSFKDFYTNFECIGFVVDFYHTKSDKFLTYNREKILPNAINGAIKILRKALCNYIENNFDKLDEEKKPYAALSYIVSLTDIKYKEIDKKFIDYLDGFPVNINGSIVPFKELLHKIKSNEIQNISVDGDFRGVIKKELENTNCILNKSCVGLFHIIKFLITKDELYYSIAHRTHTLESINFSKDDIQPTTDELFKNRILEKSNGRIHRFGCRLIFPAWGDFRKLSIKGKFDWADVYDYSSYKSDFIVLPLNFKYNMNDKNFYEESDDFINWIFNHRKNDEVKIEEMKILNKQLIDHIKNILQNDLPDEELVQELKSDL